ALGGCATFSKDGGFDAVDSAVRARTGAQPRWAKSEEEAKTLAAEVAKLLASPLGPDQAVQVALYNNRGLQAAYAELGIAESDLVQAGRWVNPGFSFARLERGEALQIDRTFLFDVLALITMPRRVEIARARFEQVQLQAAAAAVRLASEARRAWFEAVAARESEKYAEQVQDTAEAGAELAGRMAQAGNFSALDRLREQAFYVESSTQLARARRNAAAARERLTRVLGLPSATDCKLPERLAELPTAPREPADLEATALRERLDVQAAKRDTEALAQSLGLTGATRFVDVLELGALHNSESGLPPQKGWQLELRLPVFDGGGARLARARELYMQSLNRTAQIAVNARSEVREAYAAYRTAYGVARRYRDEIVPLRKKISDENLLRYNGMLISVFELLADAREQVASVDAAIRAQRDFWLADADLQLALTGGR
ncbi:MAG TPA: TolC family protein, partial [Burkholderiales bacterium]|nr:TolC family protein [Burkholderiales bacterium]